MQVLVLAVQNAVEYKNLGTATSGVTLARGIGGSLGTAIFGTVFTTQLRSQLRGALTGPLAHQVSSGGRLTGAQVLKLPQAARLAYQHGYVHALQPVFLIADGVAAGGFVLSMFLPQRKLRAAAAASTGLDDGFAAPRSSDSLAEVELALTKVTTPEERARFRERVAERSGVEVSPGAIWALIRIDEYGPERAARSRSSPGSSRAGSRRWWTSCEPAGWWPGRMGAWRSPRPGWRRPSGWSGRGASSSARRSPTTTPTGARRYRRCSRGWRASCAASRRRRLRRSSRRW